MVSLVLTPSHIFARRGHRIGENSLESSCLRQVVLKIHLRVGRLRRFVAELKFGLRKIGDMGVDQDSRGPQKGHCNSNLLGYIKWLWLKTQQLGLRRFCSIYILAHLFEPQPNLVCGFFTLWSSHVSRTLQSTPTRNPRNPSNFATKMRFAKTE